MCYRIYRVPRNKAILDEWKKSIGSNVDERNIDLRGLVCISHFLESDIKSNKLIKGAIPKIFNTNDANVSTAHDGVTTVTTDEIEYKQYSLETPERFDWIDSDPPPIASLPTASDDIQVPEKSQRDQNQPIPCSNESCQNDRVKLVKLERMQNEHCLETNNMKVKMYKFEDEIKSLQATKEKQNSNLANMGHLNKQLIQQARDSCKIQKLLEAKQQKYELEISSMKEILEVCNVSNIFIA